MSTNNQKRAERKGMLTNERQNKIMDFLKEHKTAVVRELAASLYVSEATVATAGRLCPKTPRRSPFSCA